MLLVNSIMSLAQEKTTTYFVVNINGKDILTKNLMASPTMMEEMEVVNRQDIPKYFSGKVDNVILIKVKPSSSVHLITLTQLYDKYKADATTRSLQIRLDGDIIKDTSNFLIDENSVKSATVVNNIFNIKSDIPEKSRSKMHRK